MPATVKRTKRASIGWKRSTLRRDWTGGRFGGAGVSRRRLLFVDLGVEPGEVGAQRFDLAAAIRGVGGLHRALAVLHACEYRLETVEILLGDRIELVIVAAGAADRQAEERRPCEGNHVRHVVHALLQPSLGDGVADQIVRAADQEAGGGLGDRIALTDHVAGQLLPDESRIRSILVERLDDVVAVGPGIGPQRVHLVAVALGEARHVQPVAAPALAVLRPGQQPVHQLLVGVRRLVLDEGVDFVRRRRQPDQVERHAADVRPPIRLGGGRQALRLQPGEDEGVDGVAHPIPTLYIWNGRPADRLQRPPVGAGPALLDRRLEGLALPRYAGVDPAAQQLDLGVGERSVLRHLAFMHLGVEQAVARLAGDHHDAGLAALEQPGARGQVEAAAQLDGVVAFEAVRLQQRRDLRLERRGGVRGADDEKGGQQGGSHGGNTSVLASDEWSLRGFPNGRNQKRAGNGSLGDVPPFFVAPASRDRLQAQKRACRLHHAP